MIAIIAFRDNYEFLLITYILQSHENWKRTNLRREKTKTSQIIVKMAENVSILDSLIHSSMFGPQNTQEEK